MTHEKRCPSAVRCELRAATDPHAIRSLSVEAHVFAGHRGPYLADAIDELELALSLKEREQVLQAARNCRVSAMRSLMGASP